MIAAAAESSCLLRFRQSRSHQLVVCPNLSHCRIVVRLREHTRKKRVVRDTDDLDELRQALGDAQVVLLGHSMGGIVAQMYALRQPEHCARLLLVGKLSSGPPQSISRTSSRPRSSR